MKRLLLTAATAFAAATALPAADAFYICSGYDNAPLRRNGNGDRGISFDIAALGNYTYYESTDLETWTSTGVTAVGDGDPIFRNFSFGPTRKFYRVKRESPID